MINSEELTSHQKSGLKKIAKQLEIEVKYINEYTLNEFRELLQYIIDVLVILSK